MADEFNKVYICNRKVPACTKKCTARIAGLRITDTWACQYTHYERYSLATELGIPHQWRTDPFIKPMLIEDPKTLFDPIELDQIDA